MTINNLEEWRNYTKYLFTTETYITFGWLFTVSSALQRRVWFGDYEHGQPLFCNLYGTLVGPPAVGKGQIMSVVKDFLTYHKVVDGYETNPEKASNFERATKTRLLFPKGPEDITYQAFLQDLSECILKYRYTTPEGKSKLYVHSSMFFCLEELESLFKRGDNEDRLHKFLLQAWDCKDVRYKTKHQGDFEIHNPCVNILAAVQPDRLAKLFSKDILTDGFLSRTILIFESSNTRKTFFLRQPDSDMQGSRKKILEHLRKLSTVFGEIRVSKEVHDYLQNWYETVFIPGREKVPSKLESYYERKPVHVQKLAAAYWFTDNTTLDIEVDAFKMAIEFLDTIEVNMRRGLTALGKNELNVMAREVLKFIKSSDGANIVDLLEMFSADMRKDELLEVLNDLILMNKVTEREGRYYAK